MRRTRWLLAAVLLATALAFAEGTGRESDYSKGRCEESRRRLPEYIEWLHSKNPPVFPEFIVLWISYSDDPRAVQPMIEVLSDTTSFVSRGFAPYVTAADFLGKMGDKRAIPVLTRNLSLTRRFESSVWNDQVHIECAAALFRLGQLQKALPVFRSVLAMGDRDLDIIPSNAFRVVGTPLDSYRGRAGALDTIYGYLREAATSGNAELRAGAALQLVDVDTDLAFRVATDVLNLRTPERVQDPKGWYYILGARRAAVLVLGAIGDARAKLALKALLTDSEKSVRVAADHALSELSRSGK